MQEIQEIHPDPSIKNNHGRFYFHLKIVLRAQLPKLQTIVSIGYDGTTGGIVKLQNRKYDSKIHGGLTVI